ncbi:MAG: hypothetical protein IKL62_05760 [Clostridia bacterium]|nr:hypothetical protein [Clostridia bacterium]
MALYKELLLILPIMEKQLDKGMIELFIQCEYSKISYYFLPMTTYIKWTFLYDESSLKKAFLAVGILDINDMVSFVVTSLYIYLKEKSLSAD